MRTVVRYNPMAEIRTMDEMLDRMVKGVFPAQESNVFPIDLIEEEGLLTLRAAVPGVAPDALQIQVHDGVLSLKATTEAKVQAENARYLRREIAVGEFRRSIRLPEQADVDNITATFANGLVEVRIPRIPQAQPREVKVQVLTPSAEAAEA